MNTEDWWATYCGLVIFVLVCIVSLLPVPEDTNVVPQWTDNPFTNSETWYYWILSIPTLLFLLAFSFISFRYINKTKKEDERKKITYSGLVFIFVLAFFSIFIGNQSTMRSNGIGSSMWSIFIGMLFSNCIFRVYHVLKKGEYQTLNGSQKNFTGKWFEPCLPQWLEDCTLDEFFIKISLVVLAMDLLAAKETLLPSMIVAWVDTTILIPIIYLIGTKVMGIESDYSLIMSTAVSVCGSSAANAVGTTIGVTKDKIAYPIAIMSFFTVPLIPLMPVFFDHVLDKDFGWNSEQGGAWIGGSIDSTGAVIASSSMINTDAKSSAAIVKMLQNCLIGPICLVIIFLRQRSTGKDDNQENQVTIEDKRPKGPNKFGLINMLIDRFPKFVLGFFLVCGLITAFPNSIWKTRIISTCLAFSSWFETIGFVCIGLNIQISQMISKLDALKLVLLYVLGQAIDITTTAIASYYSMK